MVYYRTGGVFRQVNAHIKVRKMLIKHIIDHPAAAPSGRIMSSLAGAGGLAGRGGIAGQGGGLAG